MEKSDKRTRKLLKNLTDIIFVIMIAVLAIIYLPGLAGYKGYCVLSASMQPKYSVGSMVYVRHADMQDITTGDVITFYINEDTLVTHRVVGKESENGGFLTKGDANEVNDGGTVLYDNIVGKVAFSIPLLGYVSSWISSTSGKSIVIGVLLVIMLIEIIAGRVERMSCTNVLQ